MALLPSGNSTQLTAMRFSALNFCLTGSLTNVKIKAGGWYELEGENPQWISTGPQSNESGEPESKNVGEIPQDNNDLVLHNTIINAR